MVSGGARKSWPKDSGEVVLETREWGGGAVWQYMSPLFQNLRSADVALRMCRRYRLVVFKPFLDVSKPRLKPATMKPGVLDPAIWAERSRFGKNKPGGLCNRKLRNKSGAG